MLEVRQAGSGNYPMEFLNQYCELTLREGLEESYSHNPEVASMSRAKAKLLTDHDLTHVIFGCDTSIVGELMLKPWILLGCNVSMDELKEYAADPDLQRLLGYSLGCTVFSKN